MTNQGNPTKDIVMTDEKTDSRNLTRAEMDRMAWKKTIKQIYTFIGGLAVLFLVGYTVYELFLALNIRGIIEEHKSIILVFLCGFSAIVLVSWWVGSIIISMKKDNMEEMFGIRD